jgi:predicted nucleic acid-binding protein
MILVDANVPMYLVGADHSNKILAQRMLERAVTHRERLVTDAEAFQEILRHYVAIGRRDAVQPAFDALSAAIDEVFPVEMSWSSEPRTWCSAMPGCQPGMRFTWRPCRLTASAGS